MTRDEDFVIDRHPRHRNIIIAGGMSGHGFKTAPAVGRIVAELVSDDATALAGRDLTPYRIARLLRPD